MTWLNMHGYDWYVWSSYGIAAAIFLANVAYSYYLKSQVKPC